MEAHRNQNSTERFPKKSLGKSPVTRFGQMKTLHERIGFREHGIAQGEKGHETTARGILHSKGRMSPPHHAIGEDIAINMEVGIHMDTATLKKFFFNVYF